MSRPIFAAVGNAVPLALSDCPEVSPAELRRGILEEVARGGRICALFGRWDGPEGGPGDRAVRLTAVLACPRETGDADPAPGNAFGTLRVASCLARGGYPALTRDCPQAHLFEREIFEQTGLRPEGHPWLKPVRFPPPDRPPAGAAPVTCGVTEFYRLEGEEVHEVAVGPVHAGVIEPGHFRFQCHGEEVHHLEISLGYQHRGVERALVRGPAARRLHYLETLAGDTSVGHTLAFCQAAEGLGGAAVPARAQALRGAALELERLANHIGDLGALAGDVGFLPTQSYCGRIRGDVLNLTALLCGNRFGRGLVRPGGVAFDLDADAVERMRRQLAAVRRDLQSAAGLLWATPTVTSRFEGAGALSGAEARDLGLVGVAARACGLPLDTRRDHPAGVYTRVSIPVSIGEGGDVYARAWVRWLEAVHSLDFLESLLKTLPEGPVSAPPSGWAPGSMAVSLVEGWRGEICHVLTTDETGGSAHYKVVDPSFHNWFGLAFALRGQQISDFPLCNKSFNLSYCGHDL